jgi:phospholipase C
MTSQSASMGARAIGERPFPDLPEGTDTLPQIDHILVLMMENHTYDNWLGMLGRGPGQQPRGDGFTIGPDGQPTATNPTPDGQTQHAFHMPTTCQLVGKPTQEWTQSHIQFDGGSNNGFVKSESGPVAMGYWTGENLPWSYSLATIFPLADRWFSSVLGQTFPNRRYLLAATSVGMVDDILPEVIVPPPNGTIYDLLDAHQISWRNYYSTFPATSYLYLGDAIRNLPSVVPVDQFFTDAKSDSLPAFAIIDPDWDTNSGEDPQNIVHAEVFAASVVQAVMDSPAWPRTLLVWTFDEGGGYYDHVPPPAAVAPSTIGPDWPAPAYTGFAQYGFRVPAVVVSPWSRPDHVTSVVHDHTSILAMVERKWNLPALTHRDAAASDLSDFLDLNQAAFATPPTLAAPLAGPAQLACEQTGPGQIPPPGSVTPASQPGQPREPGLISEVVSRIRGWAGRLAGLARRR